MALLDAAAIFRRVGSLTGETRIWAGRRREGSDWRSTTVMRFSLSLSLSVYRVTELGSLHFTVVKASARGKFRA